MDLFNPEWETRQQLFQSRNKIALADLLDRADNLILRDLINSVNVIEALHAIPVALMDCINTNESRTSLRGWTTPYAYIPLHWVRAVLDPSHALIGAGLPEIVKVRDRDGSQALILLITLSEGPFTKLFDGCTVQVTV